MSLPTAAACTTSTPDISASERLYLDVYVWDATFDLAGSSIALLIGTSSYGCSWVGTEVTAADGTYSQYARSNAMFCGSSLVPQPGDVQLTAGRYLAQPVIVAADGQHLVLDPTPIVIR